MRNRLNSTIRRAAAPSLLGIAALAFLSGLAGGIAMVPVGVLLKRGLGYPLNVYGEILLERVLGRASPAALAIEHFAISWCMAVPPAALTQRTMSKVPFWGGMAYGAAIWLVLNSLALPLVFARPTPWSLGWTAIWPSLLIHLLYGAVTFATLRRVTARTQTNL